MTVKLTAPENAPAAENLCAPPEAEPHLRQHLHPGVVGVLEALADPMRMAIVRRLASGVECPCGWLGLPIS
jgi:hypothetical protein